MKMFLCSDIKLGAVCTENLDTKRSHKWQKERAEKFAGLLEQAAKHNASYVALFGNIFGRDRVSEAVIDSLFASVRDNGHIQVLAFLSADEFNRITYRNDAPKNLHLICMQTADLYVDDAIAIRINRGVAEIQLADNELIHIGKLADGFSVRGLTEEQTIPSFEPTGFEDAGERFFGYGVLEWFQDKFGPYMAVRNQKYAFRSIDLKIFPHDEQKVLVRKINDAIKNVDVNTFLRITIVGKSAFGLLLNGGALKAQLQKSIFFVEVYDNTIMDIDEAAFENDISLRGEFVRLALQDRSLSELERNRLIHCGWNALNGKEVSEE